MQTPQAVGMPWFHEDDYEAFRAVLPERSWHSTYGAWLAAAEQNVERLEKQGVRAFKAHIRSHELVDWCTRRGCRVDTQALLGMANEFAARQLGYADPHE